MQGNTIIFVQMLDNMSKSLLGNCVGRNLILLWIVTFTIHELL